jgi:hypothetical protein
MEGVFRLRFLGRVQVEAAELLAELEGMVGYDPFLMMSGR